MATPNTNRSESQILAIGAKLAGMIEGSDNGLGDVVKFQGKVRRVQLSICCDRITLRTGRGHYMAYETLPAGMTYRQIVDYARKVADETEVEPIGDYMNRARYSELHAASAAILWG